jgi:hypothetical protein
LLSVGNSSRFSGCHSPGIDRRCPYGVDLAQSPSPASPDLMSTAKLSAGFDEPTIIKNVKLIVCKGAPHRIPSTVKDEINANPLAFIKV